MEPIRLDENNIPVVKMKNKQKSPTKKPELQNQKKENHSIIGILFQNYVDLE